MFIQPLNRHTPWQVLFPMQEIPITFQGHVVVNDSLAKTSIVFIRTHPLTSSNETNVPSLIKDTNLHKALLMQV